MVMGEVSLCRVEQLLFGVALQLRPTLAIGNPAVLSVDCGHIPSVIGSAHGAPEWKRRWLLVAVSPGGHGEHNPPNPALAIRFHNVAGTGSRR